MNFPTSPGVFWWKPAAWLRVTGADAANFLQGQFSNDLRAEAAGGAIYGLWLNVKGKVVADSFVITRRGVGGDEFWIGSYFSAGAAIREKLESFIIADDVTIEDVIGEWAGVTLVGDGVEAAKSQDGREGFVFRGRRGAGESVEWIFPTGRVGAVRARLAAFRAVSADEITRRRIEAAIPAVPADVGPGDLPNEGGLEEVAISYTKGCYLGQEVIARLKSLGQVRRRLVRVAGAGGEMPPLPAMLFAGARQVGELRSAVQDGAGGFVGMAMLTLMHVDAQSALAFAPDTVPTVRLISRP